MIDLVAGHVKALFEPATAPAVKAGQLIGLGVLDSERSSEMPDVPTMDEAAKAAGLPGFHIPSWQAAFAPKGTPKEIVDRMSSAIREAAKDPQVIERTRITSLRVVTTTPEEMAKLLRENYEQYGQLIKKAGLKMQE
jgi:tripartite-type tricarboxylate transporter receptor subunit TctC